MLRNTLLLRVLSAMAIGLAVAGAPGLSHAASPLSLPPAGMGSVVLVNQDGGNETLSVNFAGTPYTIAPQGSSSPNQVEFSIPPGTYSYVASVAGIGSVTGSVTIPQGRVISLAFIDNAADLANGDQNVDDQPVITQQIVAGNDDENAEGDNDNDHENNEDESNKLQAEESELHRELSEVNESAAAEAAEHDTVAKNDDGIKTDLSKVNTMTTDAAKTTTTTTPPTTPNMVDPGKSKNVTTDTSKVTTNTVDPGKSKNVTTDTNKVTTKTLDAGKSKNVTTDAGKTITPNTFNAGKGKNVTTDTNKVTTKTLDAGKSKIVTPNTGKITVPFNPGRVTNFSTNVGKPSTPANTNSHSSTNSSTTTLCVPGSPLFPACSNGNNGHSQGKGKSGKKGDFLTISYTPADSGATIAMAADEGKNKKHDDDDSDNEGSEQTVTNVVTPAFDNDELLVTVTDVTAQAQ